MKNRLTLLLALALAATTALGQSSGTNSPYSRYGWGRLADESQSFNLGMGEVALGFRGPAVLNVANPASYSAIDSLTFIFDVGMTLTTAHMTVGNTSVNPQNSTFDRATAGFRLTRHLGFALGLRPLTYIGYNFSNAEQMPDIDGYGEKTVTSASQGSGGMHLAFAGLGWEPFKGASIGANLGFLWGEYNHNSAISFSDNSIQPSQRTYTANLNTYTLDLGAQFTKHLSKQTVINLGLTYGLGHCIKESAYCISMEGSTASGAASADTLSVPNAHEVPMSLGAGLTLNHKNQWIVGLDYATQLWKDCRMPRLVTENGQPTYKALTGFFSNMHKIALGIQYTPKPNGLRVRDHINYRAGISYRTPYFNMEGKNGPKTYTATVGMGLPIVNRWSTRSNLNIALEYQRVDTGRKNDIVENYFGLRLGLLFNARWFNKWQVE